MSCIIKETKTLKNLVTYKLVSGTLQQGLQHGLNLYTLYAFYYPCNSLGSLVNKEIKDLFSSM